MIMCFRIVSLLVAAASLQVFLTVAIQPAGAAEPGFQDVFEYGEGGYAVIRTPQILTTLQVSLLVFAQGRNGDHDQSGNDIILKRSVDGGKSWSKAQVIAEDGKNSLNSICVLQIADSGRILVVGCIIPAGHAIQDLRYSSASVREQARRQGRADWPPIATGFGKGSVRVYTVQSDDDGKSWSRLRDITREAKREDALTCVPGPGIGIQLRRDEHKGRIVVPCNQLWLQRSGQRRFYRNQPYALISDDGGSTWRCGKLAPEGQRRALNANENQMVELEGGRIMLNGRGYGRVVATSADGGETWTPLKEEAVLVGPACTAGLYRYSWSAEDKSRILFSLPKRAGRNDGTLWLRYDEGKTWPVQKTLRQNRFAYSCLTRLPNGDVGCVFGGNCAPKGRNSIGNGGIVFARVSLEWLSED